MTPIAKSVEGTKLHLYERIIPVRRLNYAIFWTLVGIIYFSIQEAVLKIDNEQGYLVTRFLLALVGFSGQIISMVTLQHYFRSTLLNIQNLVKIHGQTFESWSEQIVMEMFSLKSFFAKVLPVVFVIAGNITILQFKLPYQANISNIMWLIQWQIPLIISGFSAYTILAGFLFLRRLDNVSFVVPFYRVKHPAIMSLWSYYSIAILVVVIFYVSMILVIWQSPYGFAVETLVWIIAISFLPLALVLLTFIQTHNILRRIKFAHIEIANKQVQTVLGQFTREPSKDNAEALKHLVEVQRQVEQSSDWPINIGSIFTFMVTLALPTLQIVLYLYKPVRTP